MRQTFVHCHPNYKKLYVYFISNKIQNRTHTNIIITQETDALIFDNIQDLCIIKQPNTENNYTIKNKRQNKGLRY